MSTRYSQRSMQRPLRLRSFLGSRAAEVGWWWPSEVRSSIDFDPDRIAHVSPRLSRRSHDCIDHEDTTDAATEREHPTRRRRLSRLGRHPRSRQSHIVALDALVALPADHPPRCDLFPLSQHLCRLCFGHNSSAKKESPPECSPSVRFFDTRSLASSYHKIPMVPQVSQVLGPTHSKLSIRIRFPERYSHHDRSRLCSCVVQGHIVIALFPHRGVLYHAQYHRPSPFKGQQYRSPQSHRQKNHAQDYDPHRAVPSVRNVPSWGRS